ncbi:hypothetical protein AV530_013022 [Patagioenas fasciata monilis]|uniref:Uncharacterized protein n=1 Tax=Patagioenas fasciata monilis TaxID=372326 RepID=A0A1V4JA10_PATFA|nr:hypothetical protein AV530_013022 [Patagioenas fasciata monilis]
METAEEQAKTPSLLRCKAGRQPVECLGKQRDLQQPGTPSSRRTALPSCPGTEKDSEEARRAGALVTSLRTPSGSCTLTMAALQPALYLLQVKSVLPEKGCPDQHVQNQVKSSSPTLPLPAGPRAGSVKWEMRRFAAPCSRICLLPLV